VKVPWKNCDEIKLYGVEDFAIDRDNGLLFLSSLNRKKYDIQGIEDEDAGIYLYDLKLGGKEVLKLPLDNFPSGRGLHPHGIGLYKENNQRYLFVVNHAHHPHGEFVEIFHYHDRRLSHISSASSDLFKSLNDVFPVGIDRFYVTNDHSTKRNQLLHLLDDLLNLCMSNVVYYDQNRTSSVLDGLCFPNGVNGSPDGKYVYVTESTTGDLGIYSRDFKSGNLKKESIVNLGFTVDNIDVDGSTLYVAGHYNQILYLGHVFSDGKIGSPSETVQIAIEGNKTANIESIWRGEFSLCSVGSVYEDKLILGTILADHFLICHA